MLRTPRHLVPAGVLVVVVGVSGCGGSSPHHPRALAPLSSTSAAATPSASGQQPDVGAATTGVPTSTATITNAGLGAAAAVVRSYFRVVNGLQTHMDGAALARLMTPDCTCREQVNAVRAAAARGERFVYETTIVAVTVRPDGAGRASVLVEYNTGAAGIIDSSGRRVTSSRPQRGLKRLFRLRHEQHGWLIGAIQTG